MARLAEFTLDRVQAGEVALEVAVAGTGPPAVLLHGYPETHLVWHAVAPRLAERYTVVCLDLRGYGASDKPSGDPGHHRYAKRASGRSPTRRPSTPSARTTGPGRPWTSPTTRPTATRAGASPPRCWCCGVSRPAWRCRSTHWPSGGGGRPARSAARRSPAATSCPRSAPARSPTLSTGT